MIEVAGAAEAIGLREVPEARGAGAILGDPVSVAREDRVEPAGVRREVVIAGHAQIAAHAVRAGRARARVTFEAVGMIAGMIAGVAAVAVIAGDRVTAGIAAGSAGARCRRKSSRRLTA